VKQNVALKEKIKIQIKAKFKDTGSADKNK
jgi:hypothetical protein